MPVMKLTWNHLSWNSLSTTGPLMMYVAANLPAVPFFYALPTVPTVRGEWRGLSVLMVGIRGKILEDVLACESPHCCHHISPANSLTG